MRTAMVARNPAGVDSARPGRESVRRRHAFDIAALRAGEEREWTLLVETIGPMLERWCRRWLPAWGDVDAAVGDTWFRAWSRIGQFVQTESADVATWVFAIARNVSIDQFRRSTQRGRRVPLQWVTLEEQEAMTPGVEDPSPPDTADDPLAKVPRGMERTIATLTAWGLDRGTIAELMRLPYGTVASRLHRLRKRLRGRVDVQPVNWFTAGRTT